MLGKVDKNQLFSDIYEKNFSPGILKFSAQAEFPPSRYPYEESGYSGPDILENLYHPDVLYRLNTEGFFGDDFIKNSDIIALGCSITAGVGVQTKYSWPQIVKERTGMSVNHIGLLGGSIQQLVSLVIDFMAIHGKPKHLLFLAPDMTRQWVFDYNSPFRNRYEFDELIDDFLCYDKKGTIKKNLDGMNIDIKIVVQNSFNSLSILSNLCQLLDINYGFCTWSYTDAEIYEKFNFKNYIPNIPQDVLNKKLSSYKPNDENSAYWDIGTDKKHQGVRGHLFHAERFMTILD
jgi:hypothetical protein